MTDMELKVWAIEVFWPSYQELCRTPFPNKWTGGARGEAVARILKMKPSEELRNRIMFAIAEQKKHRQKKYEVCGSAQRYEIQTKYVKLYSNRDGKTWLNNNGWEDEIPSIAQQEQEVEGAKIEFCKGLVKRDGKEEPCGKKATQQESLCARCYTQKYPSNSPTSLDVLRGAARRLPALLPGESQRERFVRLYGNPKKYGVGTDKTDGQSDGDSVAPTYGPEDDWSYSDELDSEGGG